MTTAATPAAAATRAAAATAAAAAAAATPATAATRASTRSFAARVYDVVRTVPRGRVASYGAIAAALGSPRAARAVGAALAALDNDRDGGHGHGDGSDAGAVPWWRVINAEGRVSIRGALHGDTLQRTLLRREGVRFGRDGRVDWQRYGWQRS